MHNSYFRNNCFFAGNLLVASFFAAFAARPSSGLAVLALARPVFFSGAMNLPRSSFFLSGAAAMVRGWGPAWLVPLRLVRAGVWVA